MNIEEVNFAHSPYDILYVEPGKKTIIKSLVKHHVLRKEGQLNDIIKGNGSGVIILLQYGPTTH
jgi:hypothetical protein